MSDILSQRFHLSPAPNEHYPLPVLHLHFLTFVETCVDQRLLVLTADGEQKSLITVKAERDSPFPDPQS